MSATTIAVQAARPPVWGWISAGDRALVLGASLGSFVHVHDSMSLYGQAGFFAWLAAGVIELGGILGILLLSQATRISGALPTGIIVVTACQGISLWANQAMVTATAGAGHEINARISGVVFPAVVVLGLGLELVMQRHHEQEARSAREAEARAEAAARAAQEREQKEAERRVVEARETAEAKAREAKKTEDPATAVGKRPAQRRAKAPATAAAQGRSIPVLEDAVTAALNAGVDTSKAGWYVPLSRDMGGSRSWWKERVAPELAAQAGVVRVTS
jgi:hypothetical protein